MLVGLDCGADHVNYGMLLDSCGGHALPYHYHEDLACDYNANEKGEHSPLVGVALDGHGLYGLWEGNGVAPTDLDACGGHVGPVPAFTEDGQEIYEGAEAVYHYHTQKQAPYTLGCYGPVDDLAACKALYSKCNGLTVEFETDEGTIDYDDDCTCYHDQKGARYNNAEPRGAMQAPAPIGAPEPVGPPNGGAPAPATLVADSPLGMNMITEVTPATRLGTGMLATATALVVAIVY